MSFFNNEDLSKLFTAYLTWAKNKYEEELGRPLVEDDYEDFIQKVSNNWGEPPELPISNWRGYDIMVWLDYLQTDFGYSDFTTYEYLDFTKSIITYFEELGSTLTQVSNYDLYSPEGVLRYALYVELNSVADISIYFPKTDYCFCVKHYDNKECCICLESSTNCFTGCGHIVCIKCNERLPNNKCPVCRQETDNCLSCSGIRKPRPYYKLYIIATYTAKMDGDRIFYDEESAMEAVRTYDDRRWGERVEKIRIMKFVKGEIIETISEINRQEIDPDATLTIVMDCRPRRGAGRNSELSAENTSSVRTRLTLEQARDFISHYTPTRDLIIVRENWEQVERWTYLDFGEDNIDWVLYEEDEADEEN